MKPSDGMPREESLQTDESLRLERKSALATTRAAEELANVLVERARGIADAVLSAAPIDCAANRTPFLCEFGGGVNRYPRF